MTDLTKLEQFLLRRRIRLDEKMAKRAPGGVLGRIAEVIGLKRLLKIGKEVCIGNGLFHQFGSDYEEFESGPGNFSTAIIEMYDGTVKNIPVEMIVFNN